MLLLRVIDVAFPGVKKVFDQLTDELVMVSYGDNAIIHVKTSH